jgi:hypothetical protein
MAKSPRDYPKEYRDYGGTEEQKKRRAQRNKARREAMKKGLVTKGDGKEVDHISSNRKGKLGNKTKIISKTANRRKQPKRDGSQD